VAADDLVYIQVQGYYSSNAGTFAINVSPIQFTSLSLNTLTSGSISAGGSQWYVFPATVGALYTIDWNDFYNSSNSCFVVISAYHKDKTTAYFIKNSYFTNFNTQQIVAADDLVYIQVQGYYSSGAGTFAINVSPLQPTLLSFNTWTPGSITAGNCQWYVSPATVGTQYTVNWDEGYTGSGHNYTCDVKVSAYHKNLTTAYFTNIDKAYSSPQTITATEDYIYIKVQGYYSSNAGTFAIKVTPPQYTLTITLSGTGSTNPSGSVSVIDGISTSIKAIPNAGYQFTNWTKTAGTGNVTFGDINSADTTVTVTGGNATIQANFTINQTIQYTLTVTHTGNGSTVPSGTITVDNGVSTPITATPNGDFVNWTKIEGTGTVLFGNANASSTTVTIIGGNAKIQANFALIPLQNIITVAAGSNYSLALKDDHMVWAWGDNYYGQLGNGTNTNSTPAQVSNLTNIMAIACGSIHSLALRSDGTVWAWGDNNDGQLGNGTNINSNIPVQVSNLNDVKAISCGLYHSLALKNDGSVWTWGLNYFGGLGNGTNINSNIPVPVYNLMDVITIRGCGYFSLALKKDGTIWAWGDNNYGQLGNSANINSNIPVQVNNLTNIIEIDGGATHSLALKNDGTVWAWGYNNFGQLGNGTNTDSNIPVQVNSLADIIAISGGGNYSSALKSDGKIWAWGYNNFGQLGNGTNINSNIPLPIDNLTNIIRIDSSPSHNMSLRNDGTVWAWGLNNRGQFGNGTNTNSNIPVQVGRSTPAGTPYQFALTITNDGHGTTTPVGTMTVNGGSSMAITATADIGYQFLHWAQVGGTGAAVIGDPNAANTTVTVTGGNAVIQAVFAEQ